jgi:hypothetical protein
MNVRRVVTGHKADGKATIVSMKRRRPVCRSGPERRSGTFGRRHCPGDNNDAADGAKRIVGTAMKTWPCGERSTTG